MKTLIGVVIVIIILGFGGFILLSNKNQTSTLTTQQTQPTQQAQPTTTQGTQPTTTSAKSMTVSIANFAFDPSTLNIDKGTKVTWTNNDSVAHTIVSDPNGENFKSNTLQPGDKFSLTFDKTGTFAYHCGIHPTMKASMTVK